MVPSNFVEVVSDDVTDKVDGKDIEVFAASEDDIHKASQIIKVHSIISWWISNSVFELYFYI